MKKRYIPTMAIKDLTPKQGKVVLIATIIEKGDPRNIQKPSFSGRVCDTQLKDETGQIKFTLWNEQVDSCSVGDTIKITNGYVNEWQGELQLSTGKFGTLEVVEKKKETTLSDFNSQKEDQKEPEKQQVKTEPVRQEERGTESGAEFSEDTIITYNEPQNVKKEESNKKEKKDDNNPYSIEEEEII